jgi:rubrerythrin
MAGLTDDVYWSRQDIIRLLKVKKCLVAFYANAGGLVYDEAKGGYNARAYCQAIVSRPQKSRAPDKTPIRKVAQAYLMGTDPSLAINNAIVPAQAPTKAQKSGRPPKQETQNSIADKKIIKKSGDLSDTGIEKALERARIAELKAYQMYEEVTEKTGIISVNSLDAWQKTLDVLRKCETDFTKVLERRRVLVAKKEVQDWLEPMLEQTKTMLLNLPAKLAPSLENLPWHEIQTRLDQEIRDVINKLANFK